MAGKRLITGYTDTGNFGPLDALTRGQLATILWRNACPEEAAAYDPTEAVNESGLDGIADGKYYTAAANWAVEKGVITGFEREGGTFDFAADDAVSFEQMVTILSRLCAAPGEVAAAGGDLSRFAVGADASPWSRDHGPHARLRPGRHGIGNPQQGAAGDVLSEFFEHARQKRCANG